MHGMQVCVVHLSMYLYSWYNGGDWVFHSVSVEGEPAVVHDAVIVVSSAKGIALGSVKLGKLLSEN